MDPSFILGMEFLIKHKAKIDLNKMEIALDNAKLKLGSNRSEDNIEDKINEMTQKHNHSGFPVSKEIKHLLSVNADSISKVGLIPEAEHKIEVTEAKKIKMKLFRLPLRLKEKTLNLLNSLIEDRIIQPSTSDYSSAAFPILKKKWRGETRRRLQATK
ncbi:hypothetical protein EQH57_0422 [Dictyocoela roeselum]|nr:hypothetical protein EQH57_0422 [Dictyocoela roeselum]